MNQLSKSKRAHILHLLCEGVSQRTIERTCGVALDTVQKIVADAGDMAIAFLAKEPTNLVCEEIQADELYSFVGTRDFDPDEAELEEGLGRTWVFLAMCAKSKLILAYAIGPRDNLTAAAFMKDVASRLKRNQHGDFATMPTIATDGLSSYKEAVSEAFGADVHYGIAFKEYTNRTRDGEVLLTQRYKRTIRIKHVNNPKFGAIHTCYIERLNLDLRMQNRRFTRKTNAFSKTLLNHERQLALWIMYHNHVWAPHRTNLRAASYHGLRPDIWKIEDLIDLTDAFVVERKELLAARLAERDAPSPPKAIVVDNGPTHWVYQSHLHRSCKVHLSSCPNCRSGQGKGAKEGTGKWHPFFSLEGAEKAARKLQPDRTTVCKMCIVKQYRRRMS